MEDESTTNSHQLTYTLLFERLLIERRKNSEVVDMLNVFVGAFRSTSRFRGIFPGDQDGRPRRQRQWNN